MRAFNQGLAEHFPLVPYRDSIGRSRVAGNARRARALAVLQALTSLQARARSGRVYVGYERLGGCCHRSRSTAYRGVYDLVAVRLLTCVQVNREKRGARTFGGGKTHDEQGQVVEAANGYEVPEDLVGDVDRRPRRRRQERPGPVDQGSRGQLLAAEYLGRGRPARAGP